MRFQERQKYFQECVSALVHECVSHARDDVQFRAGYLRRDYLGFFAGISRSSAPWVNGLRFIC
jgi:hypothetical protein